MDGYPAVQRLDAEDERRSPPDVKNVADEEDVRGIAAWSSCCALTKGKNANRSQQLAERVHNIKRVMSYGDVLPRMEKWEASLKEHEKDTQKEVADATEANS